MLANERRCRKQDRTSSVTPPCASDLNFTTSCPGTAVGPATLGAAVPATPEPERPAFAGCAPLEADGPGELPSADERRPSSRFSVRGEEEQPPIANVLANSNGKKERPLHLLDRIIISSLSCWLEPRTRASGRNANLITVVTSRNRSVRSWIRRSSAQKNESANHAGTVSLRLASKAGVPRRK